MTTPAAPAVPADATPDTQTDASDTAPKPAQAKPEPDWKAESRKHEARAKENAAAAAELAALKEAQKTEAEKLTDRVTAAERERDAARVEALRVKVGAAQKLPAAVADLLRGSNEEELTAHAEQLVAELAQYSKDSNRPRGDIDQGGRSQSASTSPAQEFASLLQGQLSRGPS